MKNNLKFFVTAISLLLASTLVLAGCIYVLAESEAPPQNYLMGGRILNEPIIDDTPFTQKELEAKYSSMKSYNEETNIMTVITPEYLNEYRAKIEGNKAIPILTADEVLYIIRDTIEMFYRGGYDGFILPAASPLEGVSDLPYGEDTVYSAEIGQINIKTDIVYDIILHRLALLSSPDAFFGNSFNDTVYYVPGLAAMTDRERLAEYFAGNTDSDIDESNIPYHFVFEEFGVYRDFIKRSIISSGTAGNIEKIYPILIVKEQLTPTFLALGHNPDNTTSAIFTLDLINGGFVMTSHSQYCSIKGDYRIEGDLLILTATYPAVGGEETEIIFQYDAEHNDYICLSDFPSMALQEGQIYWVFRYGREVWEALQTYASPETPSDETEPIPCNDPDAVSAYPYGSYILDEEDQLVLYKLFIRYISDIAGDKKWQERGCYGIAECDCSWTFTLNMPTRFLYSDQENNRYTIEYRICKCKTLVDYTFGYTLRLNDEEWSVIEAIIAKYSQQ